MSQASPAISKPCARRAALSVERRYDGKKIRYTYKVKGGASDRSYGEEIARYIGLIPEKIEELVAKGAEKRGYAEIIRKWRRDRRLTLIRIRQRGVPT